MHYMFPRTGHCPNLEPDYSSLPPVPGMEPVTLPSQPACMEHAPPPDTEPEAHSQHSRYSPPLNASIVRACSFLAIIMFSQNVVTDPANWVENPTCDIKH